MEYRIVTDKGKIDNTSNKIGLSVNILNKNNIYNIELENNTSNIINIKKIEFDILYLKKEGYEDLIVKSEFGNEKYKKIDLNEKNLKTIKSFMFSILRGKDEFENVLIGFLSSHISRNYIKINKGNNITLTCVCDFINMDLQPNTKIELDNFFVSLDYKYYNLFNSYLIELSQNINYNLTDLNIEMAEENLLFSKSTSNSVVKADGNPVFININEKKYYLIDIIDESVRNKLLSKCLYLKELGKNVILIEHIRLYIEKIIELKLFNPYYVINNLMDFLKMNINENIYFAFNDCPTGLAVGNFQIYRSTIDLYYKKNLISKLINNSNSCDYTDLLVKTMIDNSLFLHKTNYKVNNAQIKKMLGIISLNINPALLDDRYAEIYKHINTISQPGFYEKKEGVFSIWRKYGEDIYIGIFNNSDKRQSIYINLAKHSNCLIGTGRVEDIITKNQYLIDNDKIYIKNIQQGKCVLLKRVV